MEEFLRFLLTLLMFFIGYVVGSLVTLSCKTETKEEQCIGNADSIFYQKMVGMKRNSNLVFNGFPAPLTEVLRKNPGETIFDTGKDTLSLVCRDINRMDTVNRYVYYVMRDKKNNLWSLFRYTYSYGDVYKLYREDEKKLKIKWLKGPRLFAEVFFKIV